MESYQYSYINDSSSPNNGLKSEVSVTRSVDGATPTPVQTVSFSYYDGTSSFGNAHDLEMTVTRDASDNITGLTYYRYYTAGEANGYNDGLMMTLDYASYERALTAFGGTDLDSVSNDDLLPYADVAYQYDPNSHVVTQQSVQGAGCSTCAGGVGVHTFAYETSTFAAGYNNWEFKETETNPDGSSDVTYTNFAGQTILTDHVATVDSVTTHTRTYYRYDDNGNLILMADPSAVTGADEVNPDLVGFTADPDGPDDITGTNLSETNGSATYLSSTSGQIHLTYYYTSTTAVSTTGDLTFGTSTDGGITGFVAGDMVKQGTSGDVIPVDATRPVQQIYSR